MGRTAWCWASAGNMEGIARICVDETYADADSIMSSVSF